MKHQNVRNRLIDSTISAIAIYGLDKTTTKAIVKDTDINEAYIYSHFSDKEDLLVNVFDKLDGELHDKLMQYLPIIYMEECDFENRCRLFITGVWNFLVSNKEKCLAFVRYYYSPYFMKYSVGAHRKRYEPILQNFSPVFKDEADVWMILNHILNVMLDFAVMVHNGVMSEEDDYEEHVFRVIYRSVEQYFKKEEVSCND